MGRKEYIGLPCNFCGFQCYVEKGLFGGEEKRTMYRCPDCGTCLCEKCVDREKHFTAVGSTLKAGLAVATCGISLIATGLRKEEKKCLKCGSKKVKEIKG